MATLKKAPLKYLSTAKKGTLKSAPLKSLYAMATKAIKRK